MRTITLSQLRYTRQLMAWLRAGETILLRSRNQVIGRIVPDPSFIDKPDVCPPKPEPES